MHSHSTACAASDGASSGTAASGSRLPTPGLILGPFYPLNPPAHANADVWLPVQGGRSRRLAVEISGRVIDRTGSPVHGAMVEIWQADEDGRYAHPSAPPPAPLDAAFSGYARLRTGDDGGYRFRTFKPGAYGESGRRRAPHIHFQVTGLRDRQITQMFFPGEALNSEDHWFRCTRRAHDLLPRNVSAGPDHLHLIWDIVLATG